MGKRVYRLPMTPEWVLDALTATADDTLRAAVV
jgi:hypothetical protein